MICGPHAGKIFRKIFSRVRPISSCGPRAARVPGVNGLLSAHAGSQREVTMAIEFGSALWCRLHYAELRREGWDHWESVRLVIVNAQ